MFFFPPLKSNSVLQFLFRHTGSAQHASGQVCGLGNYLHLSGAHPDDWANAAEVEMQRRALNHLEEYKSLIQRATGERRNEVCFAFEEAKRKFQEDNPRHRATGCP